MWRQTSHATVKCSWPRPTRSYAVCQQLSAVQRTRRLAEVRWQVMAGALKRPGCIKRQCVVMRAPWVGQTGDGIYTSQLPGTKRYVPTHSAIHIACLAYIGQSKIKQNKIFIASYFAGNQTLHCWETTHHQRIHAATACCQYDYGLILGYRNSKEIIRVSHP